MRTPMMCLALSGAVLSSTCAKRVPVPTGLPAGAPFVSWVFMSGDRDNPDQDFVCQSEPRNDCVVPASRPDQPVFSHVHFYYHGAGGETKYDGAIDIGFFAGAPASRKAQTNVTVRKNESITNQSVTGIVTSTPGTYPVTLDLTATVTGTGKSEPVRQAVDVLVK